MEIESLPLTHIYHALTIFGFSFVKEVNENKQYARGKEKFTEEQVNPVLDVE